MSPLASYFTFFSYGWTILFMSWRYAYIISLYGTPRLLFILLSIWDDVTNNDDLSLKLVEISGKGKLHRFCMIFKYLHTNFHVSRMSNKGIRYQWSNRWRNQFSGRVRAHADISLSNYRIRLVEMLWLYPEIYKVIRKILFSLWIFLFKIVFWV